MSLTIDLARRILEASKQRAHELRSPVSIAIVDAGGHLVLFERMMSPYGWSNGSKTSYDLLAEIRRVLPDLRELLAM